MNSSENCCLSSNYKFKIDNLNTSILFQIIKSLLFSCLQHPGTLSAARLTIEWSHLIVCSCCGISSQFRSLRRSPHTFPHMKSPMLNELPPARNPMYSVDLDATPAEYAKGRGEEVSPMVSVNGGVYSQTLLSTFNRSVVAKSFSTPNSMPTPPTTKTELVLAS